MQQKLLAAFEAGQIWLTVLGLVNALISAYICFNVLGRLYASPEAGTEQTILSPESVVLIFLAAIGCLILTFWPTRLLDTVGVVVKALL